ncbi:MAG: SWIM zinc finger family protein [Hyphomicrobiales bacterium]
MIFNHKYSGSSSVQSKGNQTGMNFVPDVLRDPTYFVGDLNMHIPFREAISSLHDVVISDMRFVPKDREEYKKWVAEQEDLWIAEYMTKADAIREKIDPLSKELKEVRTEKQKVIGPFYNARAKYYSYLYDRDYTSWLVLDPVITVHPDEIFFECFSKDESSYGKLSCSHNVFDNVSEMAYGTTNIDYSAALYNEFQKIRDYKNTQLKIDPSGFEMQTTNEDHFKEMKIDLPESWVRGFLQVSSAMTLSDVSFELHPMDMANFLLVLKKHKEKESPRYIKYILEPGKPIKAVFAPWGITVNCSRSIYKGDKPQEIKIWGRRRLLILERLLPICKSIKVRLMGSGLPSFYVADLGEMSFTLGLSGWSANDWSSNSNFTLFANKVETDAHTQQLVYNKLKGDWLNTSNSLASSLNMDKNVVESVLFDYAESGRIIYDINKEVYRIRELTKDPLPMDQLKFASEQEKKAAYFFDNNFIKNFNAEESDDYIKVQANVSGKDAVLHMNKDLRIKQMKCNCSYMYQNGSNGGPCEHILALRMKYLCKK